MIHVGGVKHSRTFASILHSLPCLIDAFCSMMTRKGVCALFCGLFTLPNTWQEERCHPKVCNTGKPARENRFISNAANLITVFTFPTFSLLSPSFRFPPFFYPLFSFYPSFIHICNPQTTLWEKSSIFKPVSKYTHSAVKAPRSALRWWSRNCHPFFPLDACHCTHGLPFIHIGQCGNQVCIN